VRTKRSYEPNAADFEAHSGEALFSRTFFSATPSMICPAFCGTMSSSFLRSLQVLPSCPGNQVIGCGSIRQANRSHQTVSDGGLEANTYIKFFVCNADNCSAWAVSNPRLWSRSRRARSISRWSALTRNVPFRTWVGSTPPPAKTTRASWT
jgi:hypothetical protein